MTPYVTDIEDKVTSYFNVLYRAPLTDHRLVESVLSENFKIFLIMEPKVFKIKY